MMGILQTAAMLQAVAADTGGTAIGAVRDKAAELTSLISLSDLVLVVLILVGTHYLIALISLSARLTTARLPRQRLVLMQFLPVLSISLWLLSFYVIVVGVFSPSRESLIAFAATAGIGLGFAAQDVLKNIFGGIVIVIDRPFQVGDLVDVAEYHGEVVSIGLRATRLRTRHGAVVSVPNSQMVSQPVSNANDGALHCMVRIDLRLPALVDEVRVRELCYEAAATSPYVYPAEPIEVRIEDEFRETFLTRVQIRAHVYDHRLEVAFISDVTERAKRAFREAGLLPPEMALGLDEDEARKFFVPGDALSRGGPA
ncbi:MAG TPA: mechanosensitive ion channel domain-containing protein [Longimicrobiales bacterium]